MMDENSVGDQLEQLKIVYNNKVNTQTKYHLLKIALKVKARVGVPKKQQWEYAMALLDAENCPINPKTGKPSVHYQKRGLIRLGTRNAKEAAVKASAILRATEAEETRQAASRNNLRTFFLNEVWKEDSPYVRDRLASGKKLSKAYIFTSRQRLVKYFLPWCKENGVVLLSDCRKGELRKWRNWFFTKCEEEGFASSLVNNCRVSVGVALQWAVDNELIELNAIKSVEKVVEEASERPPYTKEEINSLFSSTWPDERCRVAFMLSATTGLRLGELQGLRWVNVDITDINNSSLDVKEQYQEWLHQGFVPPKSGKPRLNVYVRKDVAEALERLRKGHPFHNCVFPADVPGVPMDRNIFARGLRAAALAAGVDLNGRLWHNARHSYVTQIAETAGIAVASKAVGHSSTKVTLGYVHDTPESQALLKWQTDRLFG